MSAMRRVGDEQPDTVFRLAVVVAGVYALRMLAKALGAPVTLRLGLGIILITTLVALVGALVVGRGRGHVTPARSMAGVWGVAVFLLAFVLLSTDPSPPLSAAAALMGLVGIGTTLAASFWVG